MPQLLANRRKASDKFETTMRQTTLTIVNPLGLHARAASKVVDVAKNFAAKITLTNGFGVEADAKRIMSLLLLGAPIESEVILRVEGEDENVAFDALRELINAGFHELDSQ